MIGPVRQPAKVMSIRQACWEQRGSSREARSSFSAPDLGTATVFTDDPIGHAVVKATHILELRAAINAVRAVANLPRVRPSAGYTARVDFFTLPGYDLIRDGLRDAAEGRTTPAALVLAIGAERLRRGRSGSAVHLDESRT